MGNRSALEWILDQYAESHPKDKTIPEEINGYRFADHKKEVIDLLMRVTRVSIETMDTVRLMEVEAKQVPQGSAGSFSLAPQAGQPKIAG